jgi:hypothetical protein
MIAMFWCLIFQSILRHSLSFLGQNLLQHVDHPDESRLDSKRLDSFIAYLKDHPSYKSEQRGQV